MIETKNVSKYFDNIKAVDNISATIKEGSVFGLVGTNGAGKSTFLRMVSGVLKPDEGSVSIDGTEVFENEKAKAAFFYISDDQYYFSNARPMDLKNFYLSVYPNFDSSRFDKLMGRFELDKDRKMNTFSKGMKKQVFIICGICSNTKYLLCDETFDGLDPVMRQAVKSLFANDMEERGLTPIIASHNLRELEDICDHVGLLHKGGILLSRDLDDLKLNIHKIQCIFSGELKEDALKGIETIHIEKRGSLYTITARGSREKLTQIINSMNPIFAEILPLSLEEIFISETEVVGYDIKKLIY